jgi:hypothetical protein
MIDSSEEFSLFSGVSWKGILIAPVGFANVENYTMQRTGNKSNLRMKALAVENRAECYAVGKMLGASA